MVQRAARAETMMPPVRPALVDPMAGPLEAIGGAICVSHAEGTRVYGDDGRSWIDCETGTGTFSLGHRHPKVCEAFSNSVRLFDMGNHHLISRERAALAMFLSMRLSLAASAVALEQVNEFLKLGQSQNGFLQPGIGKMRTVFNVSSSEAIDCAIKLARGVTNKRTIICADNAYHGSTGYAWAASAPRLSANLPARLPGFVHVPYGPADAIAYALSANEDVAAVLLEPLAVEAGCIAPPDDYLHRVHALCRGRGVLLIADESVTGLGRTGVTLACARYGITPDILVLGHALGGGVYPIYATCHREEFDAFYVRNPFVHISTFGGGEVGCMAAQVALKELSENELLENVARQGEMFRRGIASIRDRHPVRIREVRGMGLANAVEFCDVPAARSMQRALYERGVLCRTALLAPQTLLFLPPLNITNNEMAAVVEAIDASAAVGLEYGT